MRKALVLPLAVLFAAGCQPEYVVGTWLCASSTMAVDAAAGDAGAEGDGGMPIAVPWSTGFEDGFCGYLAGDGFCYAFDTGAYTIVTSPVHSGTFAAAFTLDSNLPAGKEPQARCVRQGVVPSAAYYGAWYFIPSPRTSTGNWNLFHFAGGASASDRMHSLWDVSLVSDASGNLKLTALDFIGAGTGVDSAPPVPIGSWFHVQVYLRRAADTTGELTVYQDGVVAYSFANVITTDSIWMQWYVGNLATALMPSDSTIYIDDVAITDTL